MLVEQSDDKTFNKNRLTNLFEVYKYYNYCDGVSSSDRYVLLSSEQFYISDVNNILSNSEEIDSLVKQYKDGNTDLINIIVEKYLKLVMSAIKYFGFGIPVLDLIQEGNVALMSTLDCYDASYKC